MDRRTEPAPELGPDLLRTSLDSLHAHVAVIDGAGRIIATDAGWDRFAAANGAEGVGVGADLVAAWEARAEASPGARAVAVALRELVRGERDDLLVEHRFTLGDEPRRFVLCANRSPGAAGAPLVVQHVDVTDMRLAEEAVRLRSQLLDEVDAAIIVTDLDAVVTYWSDGAVRDFGWSREEAIGRRLPGLIYVPGAAGPPPKLDIVEAGRWEGELELRRKDGSAFPADVRLAGVRDAAGRPAGVIGVSVDIGERKRAERELRAARDHLRAVTDSMGEGLFALDVQHRVTYMNAAAERLLGWALPELAGREMHDVIHHLHPDGSPSSPEDCPMLAARRDGHVVRVDDDVFVRSDGTLLPVAFTCSPFETADGVSGAVVVFGDITERKAREEKVHRDLESLAWIARINHALENGRFVLHAQPIIDLATGETVQHELLIRMLDDDGALIPPGLFLPVAEQYGLIRDIDRWVIREAVALAAAGHAVEINLSAESLSDMHLFNFVAQELAVTEADPALIVFELTETGLLQNEESARGFIEQVSRLGCHVALDDFGTGYGGFRYLKRLPVDYLKIDVEFVRDLPKDVASQHVVHAVVNLARGFGHRTVAEGVEDAETLELLREYGVDLAQGYGIGRPAPIAETLGRTVAATAAVVAG